MDQWPHLQTACLHFNDVRAPSELFFMKNLFPVRVHCTVQQVYAGYAWLINYASDAFSCQFSSVFLTHICKFRVTMRHPHQHDVFSHSFLLLVYSHLGFDLFIHLPAVCFFYSCYFSFCLFVTLPSRRRTSTLCIACRTSASFHLTVQVDPQRHLSFVYDSIFPRI